MNLGIDIDDTICFTTVPFLAYAMKFNYEKGIKFQCPLDTSQYHMADIFGWSEELRDEFILKYHDLIMKEVTIKPLARQTLEKIKSDGHVINLLTARPHVSPLTQQISLDWLAQNQIPYDQLVMDCQDKGQRCHDHKIDVFLDDAPWNCEVAAANAARSFLMNETWNQQVNDPRITRVYSWPHFYQELTAYARLR